MAYKPGSYTTYQGVKIPRGTLYYFKNLAAAFKKATGYDLLLTSGYRTYAEQKSLWDRWHAGTFSAPSVARPGTSLHESGRALDLRDSGASAGVTIAGNSRSNWMRANSYKYGFAAAGYNFREPWHFELAGHLDPWNAPKQSSSSSSSSSSKLAIDGSFGKASVTRFQKVLGTVADGVVSGQVASSKRYFPALVSVGFGSTGSAVIRALQRKLGVAADGMLGPITIKAWQRKLGVTADGYFGSASAKAAQRKLNEGKLW